jgi:hypothetical protein
MIISAKRKNSYNIAIYDNKGQELTKKYAFKAYETITKIGIVYRFKDVGKIGNITKMKLQWPIFAIKWFPNSYIKTLL